MDQCPEYTKPIIEYESKLDPELYRTSVKQYKDIALVTIDKALDLPQITLQDRKVAQQEKVFALPVEYIVEEISMFKEDGVSDGYNVRCPSCSDLVTKQTEYWEHYRGSAQIRIFVYRNDFLFSTSPLVRLPRKGLVELYAYLLSDPVAPYRFTLTDDVIYLAYRTHLSDLANEDQRERIGNELMALGKRADELDNYLIEKFNCKWATQSKQDAD